jgi:hypothetical protein
MKTKKEIILFTQEIKLREVIASTKREEKNK